MNLSDTIAILSRHARCDGFESSAILAELRADADLRAFEFALAGAMADGTLVSMWESGRTSDVLVDFPPAFGKLWDKLCDQSLIKTAEGWPSVWSFESLRLWAYTSEWSLMSQDEDLLLMDESLISWLLAIAAEPDCPKLGYMLDIVGHWARDWAYAEAGKPQFASVVQKVSEHKHAAKAAGDLHLAEYLARLGSYAQPREVDESEALQRGLDLTRCNEPSPDSVGVLRKENQWLVTLPGTDNKQLAVGMTDGAMWLV